MFTLRTSPIVTCGSDNVVLCHSVRSLDDFACAAELGVRQPPCVAARYIRDYLWRFLCAVITSSIRVCNFAIGCNAWSRRRALGWLVRSSAAGNLVGSGFFPGGLDLHRPCLKTAHR